MKIYHTETQADFDALMIELEEQGYLWAGGYKPREGYMQTLWGSYRGNKYISTTDNKKMIFHGIDFYKENYPDTLYDLANYAIMSIIELEREAE